MKIRQYGTERVVRFGADNGLVGILTEGVGAKLREHEHPRPAVLFLNSGILHRVGSCRFHVQMAREFSAAGFHCLRFDFSGIGDSDPRRDALPFEESAVIETREAMDRLQRLTGTRQFILIGLCSGADMAHETALVDERVVGLHLIDAWSYRTMGFYLRHYLPRLFSPTAWRNSARARWAHLRDRLMARASSSASSAEYDLPTYTRVFPPRDRVAADLRALVGRGVRMRLLWTSGIAAHNHNGQYASCFRDVPFGDALEEDHLPGSDHIITGLDDQATVTQRAVSWALRSWPRPSLSLASASPRARPQSTPELSMPRLTILSISLFAILASGCTDDPAPTVPDHVRRPVPVDLVGDQNNQFTIVAGVVNVCAFFPSSAGVGVASASFDVSGPADQDIIAGTQTVRPVPHCIEVWNANSRQTVDITASLVSGSGYILDRIVRITGDGEGAEWSTPLYGVTEATVTVSDDIGGAIWFKFREHSGDTTGGQGCTPGYWKQKKHLDAWPVAYGRETLFSAVFTDAFPGKTLSAVLALGGGGLNALGRHSVAALLNAASTDVDYDLTTAEVIAAFNAAYASGSRSAMLDQKDVFDMLNNQGCPLR